MVEYNWFSPKSDWVITCYIQNNRPFLADLVLYESVVETNLKFSLKNEKESLLKQLSVKIQLSAFIMNLKKLYGPSLWMGFNCLKAIESLRGGSLLFTTKIP